MFRPVEVSVEVPGGRATFRRTSPSALAMTIQNVTLPLRATLGPKVSDTVGRLRWLEIEQHHEVFNLLGEELLGVLSHDGAAAIPNMEGPAEVAGTRSWRVTNGELNIDGTVFTTKATFAISDALVADDDAALALVSAMLDGRDEAVISLYRRIAEDVRVAFVWNN